MPQATDNNRPGPVTAMAADRTVRLLGLFAMSLIAAVSFASFQVASPGGFLSDDYVFLHNAMTTSLPNLWSRVLVPDAAWGFYRPVAMLYWWLCFKLFGASPFGYWSLAVLTHALNGILLYMILKRLGTGYQGALAAGLVFVSYPLHGEAVAWLSGGFDRLCLLFMLLGLYAYVRFRESGGKAAHVLSAAFFVLALLSKEMAITFPVLVFALDATMDSRPAGWIKGALARILPFVLVAVSYIALRFAVFHGIGGYSDEHGGSLHASLDPGVIFSNITKLPALLLYPLNSAILKDPAVLMLCLSGVYVLAAAARIYFGGPGRKFLALGIIWMVIAYLPVMTLYLAFPDLIGGRFSYVPSIGLSMTAAFLLGGSGRNVRTGDMVKAGVTAALVGLYVYSCTINYSTWSTAYDIAGFLPREAVRQVPDPPPGSELYFIGRYDNFDGAYVYRNGLEDAVNIAYGREGDRRVKVGFIERDGYVRGNRSLNFASLTKSPRDNLFIFLFNNKAGRLLQVYPSPK